MKIFKSLTLCILFVGFTFSTKQLNAQNRVNWITFKQLEDSLKVKPKKVWIDFYADWCSYCKKMEQNAYQDLQIVTILNSEYYSVKMNSESKDTIVFGGKEFTNKELGEKRRPTHEIPLLLASRKGKPFSLPAILILDKKFTVTYRYFEYMSIKKMREVLNGKQ